MSVELATAFIELAPSARGMTKSLEKELGDPIDKVSGDAGDRGGRSFASKFGLGLAGLAAGVGGALALTGGFLKGAIGEASNLAESTSKVNVVFGENAAQVLAFGESAALSVGLSNQAALEATGTYGNLFKAMGIGTPTAADMSTKLVTLAGDLASFNNADPTEVLLALRAGLVGETEPLRQFGVNINEARLKAEALRLGLVKSTVDQGKLSAATETVDKAQRKANETLTKYGEASVQHTDAVRDQEQAEGKLAAVLEGKVPESLDAATKAQASYSLIMADTALARGDFERTAPGMANSGRIISAMFTDLKAKIGTAFLPIVLVAAKFIKERLLPAFSDLADRVGPLVTVVGGALTKAFESFRAGLAGTETSGFAGFLGRVVEGVKSIAGVLANVDWGAVFSRVGDVLQPVIGLIKGFAEGARGALDTLSKVDWADKFGKASEIIGPLVESVGGLARAAADFAREGLPALASALSPVLDAFLAVAAVVGPVLGLAIDGLAPVVQLLANHMNILVPALVTAAAAFLAFKAATGIASSLAKATTGLVNFQASATNAGKSLSEFKKNLRTAADNAKAIGSKISTAFGSVKTSISKAASAVVGYVKQAALWVKQAIVTTAMAIKQAAVWVAQKVAMIATAIATKAMAAAQWLLNAAMSANPITLIVIALVALAAGLVYAYTHSEKFRAIIDAIARVIVGALKAAISWVVDTAVPAIVGFVTSVVDAAKAIFTFFTDLPGNIVSALGDLLGLLVSKGVDLITGLVTGYLSIWLAVGEFFLNVGNAVLDWVGDMAKTLWNKGVDLLTGLIGGIVSMNQWLVDFFVGLPGTIINLFSDAANWLLDAGGRIARGLLDGIAGVLSSGWDFATGIIGNIADGLKWAVNGIIASVESWINIGLSAADKAAGPWINFGAISLPRFAGGAVITEPTMAMVGEVGRARPEIVTPERLMRSVFADELARGGGAGSGVEIQNFYAGGMTPQEVSRELAWTMRTKGISV